MKTIILFIIVIIFSYAFIPLNVVNNKRQKIYIDPKYKQENIKRQKMNLAIEKIQKEIDLICK